MACIVRWPSHQANRTTHLKKDPLAAELISWLAAHTGVGHGYFEASSPLDLNAT